MKSNWEQLLETAKEIRLSREDKAKTGELLLRYMRMNPVREDNDMRHNIQRSPIIRLQLIQFFYKPMAIAMVLLVAITAGGGASLAAENSVPGDVLYPVKVGINENVRGAFAFSQEAKAEWKIQQVERRLQEAEKLAAAGDLSAEAAAKIETEFDEHTESMTSITSNIQADGRAEVAAKIHSNLEAILATHAKVLEDLKGESGNEGIAQILASVEAQTQTSKAAKAGSEIELKGQIVCLPHRDTGDFQTLECAFGLQGEDGKYYGLQGFNQQDLIFGNVGTGQEVVVTGIFTPGKDSTYNTIGTIEVTSVVQTDVKSNIDVEEKAPERSESSGSGTETKVRLEAEGGIQVEL